MSVRERLVAVRERIARAARGADRDPDSVRLVAVSKGHPAEAVREAYAAGQRDFGENYVQELTQKLDALSDLAITWHAIGHLQRNKARQVAPRVTWVHSVDSVELARELGKRAVARAPGADRLRILVEVSIAGEAQKGGVSPDQLADVLAAVEAEPALELCGLMCIPPLTESAVASRAPFDELVRMRARHGGSARLPELSMGMTQDFETAVAAGSTLVRVGTAIFGERAPRGA
jgi:pyridoxal phosphate enzyme (YggS family)